MDHQIQALVVAHDGPIPFALDMLGDLCDARSLARILLLDAAEAVYTAAVENLAGVKALKEIAHVRGVAREGKRTAVDVDAEVILDDLGNILEHAIVLALAFLLGLGRRTQTRIDNIEGDACRLAVGQSDAKLLLHAAGDMLARRYSAGYICSTS